MPHYQVAICTIRNDLHALAVQKELLGMANVVEGKQLKEWESLLRERVGLPAELKVADPIVQGIGTKSICTANGFDDCDYMPL